MEPHHKTYAEVKGFAIDFAVQNKIEVGKEDWVRIQHVMKKFRICRCTREECKSLFSGGYIFESKMLGQVEKRDFICHKCAGPSCEIHGIEEIVFKCEFCCSVAPL